MNETGRNRASHAFYQICEAILFFVVAAAAVNGYFDLLTRWADNGKDSFLRALNGTADRPFVYRQLIPAAANWVDRKFPEPVKDKLFNSHNQLGELLRERLTAAPLGRDRQYFLRYWFFCCAEFLSAWLSVYVAYLLCKQIGFSPPAAALAAIAFVLFISVNFAHYYDFPELFFLLLAAWIALRMHWLWLLPLSALGTWNKESFLLYVPALYPLLRARVDRRTASSATVLIALPSIVVNLAVRSKFRHNPGSPLEFHLWDQIHGLVRLVELSPKPLMRVYGVWTPNPYHLFVIALLVWAVRRSWPRMPYYLKRHMQVAAIINVPLYFLFCAYGELRDLSFLFVSLLVIMADNFLQWMRDQQVESRAL